MKKNSLIISTIAVAVVGMLALTSSVKADQIEDMSSDLSGRILLDVQENGEAWYVNPINNQRYYLGRPNDAFNLMQQLALGISNKDFDSFNGKATAEFSGRILLKVEDWGKAYYVNPLNLKLYSLGSPADAFSIMTKLGLGITSNNLNDIIVYSSSIELVTENKNVQIVNLSFSPASLNIKIGDVITWKNNENYAYTVTSSGNFDSGNIDPGKSYSRMFNIEGVYNYHCNIHPSITGKITVIK